MAESDATRRNLLVKDKCKTQSCIDCGDPCHPRCLRCAACYGKAQRKPGHKTKVVCISCGGRIANATRAARCRKCWIRDRKIEARELRKRIAARNYRTKSCSRSACQQINPQPIENFNYDTRRPDRRCPWCRSCQLARNATEAAQKLSREHNLLRRHFPLTRARLMVTAAQKRMQRRGMEFDIDREDIANRILAGRCEMTGLAFDLNVYKNGRRNPFAPSIERIDPSRGYTKDNVQVVCCIYNVAKSDWTVGDVIKMSKALLEHQALLAT